MAAKRPLSVVPMPCTMTIMTRLIPAAINAYSIAVAPDSSAQNLVSDRDKRGLPPASAGFSRAGGGYSNRD